MNKGTKSPIEKSPYLRRIVIKEEFMVLFDNDPAKSIVLNQILYWLERKKDFDQFLEEEVSNNGNTFDLCYGWIWKSARDLEKEIMGIYGHSKISRVIKELVELNYIYKRNNPINSWDRCPQFRPNLIKIRQDLNNLGYELPGGFNFSPEVWNEFSSPNQYAERYSEVSGKRERVLTTKDGMPISVQDTSTSVQDTSTSVHDTSLSVHDTSLSVPDTTITKSNTKSTLKNKKRIAEPPVQPSPSGFLNSEEQKTLDQEKTKNKKPNPNAELPSSKIPKEEALQSYENFRSYMELDKVVAKPVEKWNGQDFLKYFICGAYKYSDNVKSLPNWKKDVNIMKSIQKQYVNSDLKELIEIFCERIEDVSLKAGKDISLSLSALASGWIMDLIKSIKNERDKADHEKKMIKSRAKAAREAAEYSNIAAKERAEQYNRNLEESQKK